MKEEKIIIVSHLIHTLEIKEKMCREYEYRSSHPHSDICRSCGNNPHAAKKRTNEKKEREKITSYYKY